MAWKIKHRCNACGYECDVYEGRGFFGQRISQMHCNSCHTVQNITVGGIIAEVAPSMGSEFGRLCPECMSDDMRIWDGTTCPKCGGRMHASDEKEFWT